MTRWMVLLKAYLCVLALLGASSSVSAAPAPPAKPNIIFILVDDLGYADLGCYGDPAAVTSNIDRLARDGVKFTQYYASSPVCSPSRCGILTGQYPTKWGILSYISNRKHNEDRGMRSWLDPRAPSLPRQLQQAGYATIHVGKWHLGGGRDVGDAPLITDYGFNESLTQFEGLGDRALIRGNNLCEQSAKLGRGKIQWHEKHELTGVYVDRALEFLRAHKDRPVFVNLWLDDVHDPLQPEASTIAKHRKPGRSEVQAKMYAVLENMDRQIGRLVDELDKLQMRERTMIILTGDNGPTSTPAYYKDGGQPPGSAGSLRGRKLSLYEGGTKEPLIVNWKGAVPGEKVNEKSVLTGVDFMPTLCAIAGAKMPDQYAPDGEDLSAALLARAEPQRKREIYWHYIRKPPAGLDRDQSPLLAVRDGDWKLLMEPDGSRIELYDLKADSAETKDRAPENPDVADRLKRKLLKWFDQIAHP